jgi:peptidyl-prolyl cis-trans isomerase A (cyclophilin A)
MALPAACLLVLSCGAPVAEKKKEEPRQTPEVFRVNLDTSKGPVVIEVHRAWAPRGVDHFYTLVKTGFYDGARFFRVRPKFVVQFGIAADPATDRLWRNTPIPDDPVKQSNAEGTICYATAGPNTRTTQVFINLADNRRLDKDGFAPFGKVLSGMEAVESSYSAYGEMAPRGQGPDPAQIERRGDEYLASKFPRLDRIKKATIQAAP